MKTERRHELQTNDLADWLGKHIQSVRPYSKALTGGIVLAAVVIFAVVYLARQKSTQLARGWDEFYVASIDRGPERVDKLEALADDHPDTTLGIWARQMAADARLAQGVRLLRIDPDDAATQIKTALDAYQAVVKQANDDLIKPRALFGLAQCYEARDEVEEAQKQYDLVIEGWPDSALANVARQRRDFLKQSSTRDFLAWFDKQEVRAPAFGDPAAAGGLPGLTAPAGNDLGAPDTSLPFEPLQPPTDDAADQSGSSEIVIESAIPPTSDTGVPPTDAGGGGDLPLSDLESKPDAGKTEGPNDQAQDATNDSPEGGPK